MREVVFWRQLQVGVVEDHNGTQKRVSYPADEAANLVQISQRTLNDYMNLIINGSRYGFDFEKNSHNGVGMLRKFVEFHKRKNSVGKAASKNYWRRPVGCQFSFAFAPTKSLQQICHYFWKKEKEFHEYKDKV